MGKYQLDDKGKALIERYHEKNSNVKQDKKSRVQELLKQARNKKRAPLKTPQKTYKMR